MSDRWRRIEADLERWFRTEGIELFRSGATGDLSADLDWASQPLQSAGLNLTELARHLDRELPPQGG